MGRKKGHRQQCTEALKLACYKPAGSSVLQEGSAATSFCIWDALEGSVSETTKSQVQNVTRASACSATGSTRKQPSLSNQSTLLGEEHKATRCLHWGKPSEPPGQAHTQPRSRHNDAFGAEPSFLRIKQCSPCSLYLKAEFYFCSL